jgi:lambda family phage tail tape measure protein
MSGPNEVKIKISTEGKSAASDDLKGVASDLNGVGESAEKASAKLAASTPAIEQYAMSAKAQAAAMRGVPAQFTDIVTSLQGGQSPLTVLMQQGGQLKDMFGGVGNAASALGSYVLGLVSPFTIAAAAAGALGYAYYKGSAESDAFQKTLVLTGNMAETTAGQLADLAKSVSGKTGATTGAVAEVLNEIVASGKVSADMLGKVSQAAIDMERAGGAAASDTAKEFESLGEAPAAAILKLNDKYHFLTASVYEQIKALQDQGRETDAVKLAQSTFFDMVESRAPVLAQNLGLLESAWKGISDTAKRAWDAMVGVGREETLDTKLAALDKKIAYYKEFGSGGTVWGNIYNNPDQVSLPDLEKQKRAIEAVIAGGKSAAEYFAEQNKEREKGIAKAKEYGDLKIKYLTNEQQLAAAIKKINESSATAEEKAAWIKQAHTQYDEKPKKAKVDPLDGLLENYRRDAVAQESGLSSSTVKEIENLGELLKRGKIDAAEYDKLLDTVLGKDTVLSAEQKKLESDREKSTRAQRLVDNYDREFETTLQRINAQNDLNGVSERETLVRKALYKIDDEYSRERDKIIEQIKDQTEASAALARVDTELADKKTRIAAATAAAYDETRTFESGWKKAFASYTDEANNAAKTAEFVFGRSTDGMADAIANFVTTGKADFSSLATSFIADLVRIQARAAMAPVTAGVGNWLTSLFDSSSAVIPMQAGGGYHSGGIVGSEPTFTRDVPASLFNNAPRYHTGGIVGGEVPTILLPGEGVFTAGQMKALGGALGDNASGIAISMPVTIDARGAESGVEQRLAVAMTQMQAWVVKTVPGVVRAAQLRNRQSPTV